MIDQSLKYHTPVNYLYSVLYLQTTEDSPCEKKPQFYNSLLKSWSHNIFREKCYNRIKETYGSASLRTEQPLHHHSGAWIGYSTVYSGADQRKHQSSASLTLGEDNSSVTDEFPAQRVSNTENVSIWWRHHALYGWLIFFKLNTLNMDSECPITYTKGIFY